MTKRMCAWGVALALLVALAPSMVGQSPKLTAAATAIAQPPVRKSAEAITAAQLRDYLSLVASDEMEGRANPSKGLDLTARFLATMLSRSGVKGAGDDGGYYQRIALKREKLAQDRTKVELAGRTFVHGRDYMAMYGAGSASGPMVYAGTGYYVKTKSIDPYKDIDPKGKIVVLLVGRPKGLTREDLPPEKEGTDWLNPLDYALKRGAVGAIMLGGVTGMASYDIQDVVRRRVEEGRYYPEKLPPPGPSPLPRISANFGLAGAIFAREKSSARTILLNAPQEHAEIEPFELSADKTISFTVKTTPEIVSSQNVVAVIEGSDPVLKNEYVALGAHYDHLGSRTTPGSGDNVFNGADDDGSGAVALLAIAEALVKAPRRPKRSVIFVWHMGEEEGLWGSQYFTTFPTVPIDKIVAQLNIDMIGRSKAAGDTNPLNRDLSGPNELYVIGSKLMSTALGQISEAVNSAYLKLSFNYKYDDLEDPERNFFRSDHINYAVKDIPVIYYFTGEHAEYHQPGDEVSTIDFQKYEKITRTIYATMWEIGELRARPKVDKPLSNEVKTIVRIGGGA